MPQEQPKIKKWGPDLMDQRLKRNIWKAGGTLWRWQKGGIALFFLWTEGSITHLSDDCCWHTSSRCSPALSTTISDSLIVCGLWAPRVLAGLMSSSSPWDGHPGTPSFRHFHHASTFQPPKPLKQAIFSSRLSAEVVCKELHGKELPLTSFGFVFPAEIRWLWSGHGLHS